MRTDYLIVGGGLSGLIMGMELSRRGIDYQIIEKSDELIEAKLHYLHSDLSKYFPFKLREIDIVNNIFCDGRFYNEPTVDMMNHFSWVTTDKIFQNSMKFIDGKVRKGWIPESGMDNISSLVAEFNKQKVITGCELKEINKSNFAVVKLSDGGIREIEFQKIISTIPLKFMLNTAGVEYQEEFRTEPLKMTEVYFEEEYYNDLFQIVYIPKAEFGYSRLSILGKRIVAEKANGNFEATEGENRLGLKKLLKSLLPNCDPQKAKFEDMTNWYGRYIPIKEENRSKLIRELERKNIICLGRYAEWTYRRTDHIVKLAEQIAEANSIKKGTI